MNANQKREFIKNHCTAIMEEALSKVDKMPEEWDGIELRQYISDLALSPYKMRGKRLKDYKNEVIVRNL